MRSASVQPESTEDDRAGCAFKALAYGLLGSALIVVLIWLVLRAVT